MERLHFIGKVIPLKEWINLNHVLLIPDFLLLSMMLVEDTLAVNECMCKYQVLIVIQVGNLARADLNCFLSCCQN